LSIAQRRPFGGLGRVVLDVDRYAAIDIQLVIEHCAFEDGDAFAFALDTKIATAAETRNTRCVGA
jgi:hypothetical protein